MMTARDLGWYSKNARSAKIAQLISGYYTDLNSILARFLSLSQIHEYIESIALDFLPQQPLRMTSDENQLNDYFNENIQTNKTRKL